MKKVLAAFLVLSSLSAYALPVSKNYESKHTNDDGTISIIKPKFYDPSGSGTSLPLSNYSSPKGVCKLYGLGADVPDSMIDYEARVGTSDRNVMISSKGRFSKYTYAGQDFAIQSIVCQSGKKPSVSHNYLSLTINDDGTKTIRNPRFWINGKNHALSNYSSPKGVCKLYGFGADVPNSMIDYDAGARISRRNVMISSKGRFSKYTYVGQDFAIQSIVCE